MSVHCQGDGLILRRLYEQASTCQRCSSL